MSIHTINRLTLTYLVSISLLLSMQAVARDKPSLSELMKTTIDQHGTTAAKEKFNQIYPKHKEDYRIDNQALNQLMRDYAQAGNMQALQVLSEVMSTITQDMIAKHMAGQEETMKALMAEQNKQAKEEQQQKSKTETVEKPNQTARNDLDRFTGLYGNPDKPDPYRQLWVAKSCDGKMVIGATWGDASPWWMNSAGNTEFTYRDSFTHLSMEFTVDSNGQATALSHDLTGMVSPLERVGPLTEEYGTCIEPFRR